MAVVLLSGGLDSALNLALAAKEKKASLAITFRYGQRASDREVTAARKLSEYYGVKWIGLDLAWLGDVNPTGLTRAALVLPKLEMNELDSMTVAGDSMKAVWVANRNGVFLNSAAAYAEAIGVQDVLVGFNAEEAATFPDNSAAYMNAINQALQYSTLNGVKVNSYTLHMNKNEIVERALQVELPLNLVWSCYEGSELRCWECESCKRSERALLSAGEKGREWLARMGKVL